MEVAPADRMSPHPFWPFYPPVGVLLPLADSLLGINHVAVLSSLHVLLNPFPQAAIYAQDFSGFKAI
jgi:hypothetical protein